MEFLWCNLSIYILISWCISITGTIFAYGVTSSGKTHTMHVRNFLFFVYFRIDVVLFWVDIHTCHNFLLGTLSSPFDVNYFDVNAWSASVEHTKQTTLLIYSFCCIITSKMYEAYVLKSCYTKMSFTLGNEWRSRNITIYNSSSLLPADYQPITLGQVDLCLPRLL